MDIPNEKKLSNEFLLTLFPLIKVFSEDGLRNNLKFLRASAGFVCKSACVQPRNSPLDFLRPSSIPLPYPKFFFKFIYFKLLV